jgi:hypothetical protein
MSFSGLIALGCTRCTRKAIRVKSKPRGEYYFRIHTSMQKNQKDLLRFVENHHCLEGDSPLGCGAM